MDLGSEKTKALKWSNEKASESCLEYDKNYKSLKDTGLTRKYYGGWTPPKEKKGR